jgi:hypothetical protein
MIPLHHIGRESLLYVWVVFCGCLGFGGFGFLRSYIPVYIVFVVLLVLFRLILLLNWIIVTLFVTQNDFF